MTQSKSRAWEFLYTDSGAKYGHVAQNAADPDVSADEEEEDQDESENNCQFCDRTRTVRRKPRDMRVLYGFIASGNQVIKGDFFRNQLNKDLGGEVLCIETEAVGLMNNFPCILIRDLELNRRYNHPDDLEHASTLGDPTLELDAKLDVRLACDIDFEKVLRPAIFDLGLGHQSSNA